MNKLVAIFAFLFIGCGPLFNVNEKIVVLLDDRATTTEQEAVNKAIETYETLWGVENVFDFKLETVDSKAWNNDSYRIIRIRLVEGPLVVEGEEYAGYASGEVFAVNMWKGNVKIANDLDQNVESLHELVTHEMGHVFWLQHTDNDDNVMNPTADSINFTDEQVENSYGYAMDEEYQREFMRQLNKKSLNSSPAHTSTCSH